MKNLVALLIWFVFSCVALSFESTFAQKPSPVKQVGVLRPLSNVQLVGKNNFPQLHDSLTRFSTEIVVDEFSAIASITAQLPMVVDEEQQERINRALAGMFNRLVVGNRYVDENQRRIARVPEPVAEAMEENQLDHALVLSVVGYTRTPANYARQSVKAIGLFALTLGVTILGTKGQLIGWESHDAARSRIQIRAVIFDRQHDRLAYFNMIEDEVDPSDEKELRRMVRQLFRGYYTEYDPRKRVYRVKDWTK
jgi:hypothetical protein